LYKSQIDNISKTPVEIIKYINGNLKRLGITDFKVEFSENFNSSNPKLLDLVYKNSQSQIENTNNAISLGKLHINVFPADPNQLIKSVISFRQ